MELERDSSGTTSWRAVKQLTWHQVWNRVWPLTVVRTLALLGIVLLLILAGYPLAWTGFGESLRQLRGDEDLQRARTLWDWLGLIVVPLALAIGAYLFNLSAMNRAEDNVELREREKTKNEERRAQENALREYVDQMGRLITEHDLHATSDQGPRKFARALTLSTLRDLGARLFEELWRKREVVLYESDLEARSTDDPRKPILQFLHEAQLIDVTNPIVDVTNPIVELKEADLSVAEFVSIDLNNSWLDGVDLTGTNLIGANLTGASLRNADLSFARLMGASLRNADLSFAKLTGANLTGTDLRGAKLTGADMTGSVGEPIGD